MSRLKSLALGFLTGSIAAGAGILLSAPYSGKELRYHLNASKRKSKEMLLDLKTQTENVQEQIQQTYETNNIIVKNIVQDLSKSVKDWKESTLPHQKAIEVHLDDIQHSLQNLEQQVQKQKDSHE